MSVNEKSNTVEGNQFPLQEDSRTFIKLRWALFVTYTIIQSITSSEMCSLHLTHPSVHTHLEQRAADTAAPGEQSGVQGSHLSRGQFQPEAEIRTHNLGLQVQRSIH